jgi:hypothetical protein
MKYHKKGNAAVWIGLIFTIFLVGTVFLAASQGYDQIYDNLYPKLCATHQATFNKINNLWDMWPILYIVAAIIAAVYYMLRRSPESGYY